MYVYSWCGTPIILQLLETDAEAYNRVADVFERLFSGNASSRSIVEFINQTRAEDRQFWDKVLAYVDELIKADPSLMDKIIASPDEHRLVRV